MATMTARRPAGLLPLEEIVRVFDFTEDGVYVVDPQQRVVYWNDAAERLTGIRRVEAIGRQCFDLTQGKDYDGNCFCRADCPTISCTRRGQPVRNYDVLIRPDGARMWINVSIMVVRAQGYQQPLAVHIFRDVTRRREAEVLAEETLAAVAKFSPEAEAPQRIDPFPVPEPQLTPREIEVLKLLASGATVRQIAQQLVVTQATVRNHIENLMGKLGVHSRLQAVVYAAHKGLL